MHVWLCSPPTNSSCHTSNARLLYFYSSLGLATVCACCSGRNVSASPVLRAADSVLCNRHLLLELLLGADVSFGSEGRHALGGREGGSMALFSAW